MSRFAVLLPISALLTGTVITGVSAADAPSFRKDIAPLLANNCSKCHGPSRQKNDLRLDTLEGVQKGGKNGPVFVPGKPAESPLYIRTTKPDGDGDRMPAQGPMLTKRQTDLLKAWIAAGAKFD